MAFKTPLFFVLLFIPLIFLLLNMFRKNIKGFGFSSLSIFKNSKKTFLELTYLLPALLFLVGYIFLVVALARPQKIISKVEQKKEGVAIELVFDRSGSMETINFDGINPISRIDSAKQVVYDFVFGSEKSGFSGRQNDLVGFISFARYADTLYPLTLSHESLKNIIDNLDIAKQELNEDGTNIGDAIALAASRLKMLDEKKDYDVKSKIIILLTDGENNVGEKTPLEAAKLAASWGIKIYAIAFNGSGYMNYGIMKVPVPNNPASYEQIKEIAKITNGKSYQAKNRTSLLAVYQDIDKLEKSEINTSEMVETEELYFIPLLIGFILILVASLLKWSIYRSII